MKTSSKHDPAKEHAEYLTARQLAEVLQIGESTVMRLARAGRIPSIRLTPRLIRFRLASVRSALEKENRIRQADDEPEVNSAQMTFDDLIN
ncbi:MAG: helix-turn-helix domain-containing protein [Pyrinomonadaceae bacterium]